MTRIEDALLEFNPWWKGDFSLNYREREVYGQMKKYLKMPQILALTGLRRVGKTTLMRKVVLDAISSGFNPKKIVYFSFDEFKNSEIREAISAYERVTEADIREGGSMLLLDEIQKLKGWEDQLKAVYDVYGKNTKILISGSESLFIRKKSKATLAGRIFEFKVEPLSFKEFIGFKGLEFKPIGIYGKELSKLFSEFTLSMGFPELLGIRDKEIISKYVKESIVEKVIYRDMAGLFKIRDVSAIESLLNIFMHEPGQIVDVSDLAAELGTSRQTVSKYLGYLEDSFLIRKLYNFSGSRRRVERKLKRYYPAFVSPELLFKEDEHSRSKVFEWQVVTQLKAEFFWRDPYKNEVDIVAEGPLPIEIKYGKIDFDGLLAFMRKFKLNEGIIVSKDTEESKKIDGKSIRIIPAFKLLLESGSSGTAIS